MKLKVALCTLFVFVMFSQMVFAAKFRCGLQKVETTLSIPRPPDVWIRDRNIQVVVAEMPSRLTTEDGNLIRRAVEAALTPSFIISNTAETIFKIYVVNYELDIKEYTQNEERSIVVRQSCTTNASGGQSCTPVTEQRIVPVKYWDATANMSWRVEVKDSSGNLIDSGFNPGDIYNSKKEVSINGVSQLGSTSLPDAAQIKSQMISRTAMKFKTARYLKTYSDLSVDLACDDELKPGNTLVADLKDWAAGTRTKLKNQDWEGALKLWETATMKKKDAEGDRLYNMAVAYEALAFKTFDASGVPEDADPQFDKALELYQQAMALDPKEKYIQRAAERLQTSKSNLRRAKEQWASLEQNEKTKQEIAQAKAEERRREEEERQKIEEAVRLAKARPESEDTSEEKIFRTYLRARLANMDVLDDNEVVTMAQGKFKLNETQALRVFEQEIDRLNQEVVHQENIKKYAEDFELFIFATNGVITKDERAALNAIAESLSLTADDIKTAESAYTFKDESGASAIIKKTTSAKSAK